MNKRNIFYMALYLCVFLLPLVEFSIAKENPNYVGINEEQTYIWYTTFDKDPLKDFYDDIGLSEEQAENLTDIFFDMLGIDTDTYAWKVYISEIKEEKDLTRGSSNIDFVNYIYNFYKREEGKDWKIEEHNKRGRILEYNKGFYMNNTCWDMGFFPLWFVATNIDWEELVEELNEVFEDYDVKGEAEYETSYYFFSEIKSGMSTVYDPEIDFFNEEFSSQTLYTREGVLKYYDWSYAGMKIIEIEMEGRIIYETWWIILIFVFIPLLAVVIVFGVLIIRKKLRKKVITPPKEEKKPVIPKPTVIRPSVEPSLKIKFCPMCGSKVKANSKYCTICGASLEQ